MSTNRSGQSYVAQNVP